MFPASPPLLSVILDSVEEFLVGQHPIVKQPLKGCFNYQPPATVFKYSSMWDLDMVLNLSRCGSNDSLTQTILALVLKLAPAFDSHWQLIISYINNSKSTNNNSKPSNLLKKEFSALSPRS